MKFSINNTSEMLHIIVAFLNRSKVWTTLDPLNGGKVFHISMKTTRPHQPTTSEALVP